MIKAVGAAPKPQPRATQIAINNSIITDIPASSAEATRQGCMRIKPSKYEMPNASLNVDLRREVTSEKIISAVVMIALRTMTRMKEKSTPATYRSQLPLSTPFRPPFLQSDSDKLIVRIWDGNSAPALTDFWARPDKNAVLQHCTWCRFISLARRALCHRGTIKHVTHAAETLFRQRAISVLNLREKCEHKPMPVLSSRCRACRISPRSS